MLRELSDAKREINKNRLNSINKKVTKLKNIAKNVPKDNIYC